MNTDILSKLVITDVYSVTTLYSNDNATNHRANRPMWAIIIKYEGETVYTSNGENHLSNLSHITVLPKGCSYDWRCIKAGHYSVVEFDCPDTHDEIFTFQVSNTDKLLKIIKRLELDKISKKKFFRLEAIKEIYAIITELLNSQTPKYTPSSRQKKIAPALDYIALNYAKKVSNEELAELCGISNVYFRKLFKDVTKQSPAEYIQSLKADKAKEMLKSDYGSITDIAIELGYPNIYDFSRSFKRHVGISPKKFKESLDI